ncbi:MAG: sigma-70 family RNA polymerase sigma factor [Firmicutes bacterium]|nr:sigma-70 family RNA polymerase sigma factor [Bacillota bacterium]
MYSDEFIADGIIKKDERAFGALVDKYGGLIKSIVRYHLSDFPSYIEDCENDILLALWQNMAHYDTGKNSLKNWIGAVSKYKCIDYKRKYYKELEMENIEDRIIAQNDVYESLKEDVQSLLAGLSEADRELFYRRYILGERVEEIARRSGRNAAILYNRLSRGRKKLKRCIKESGIK